MTLKVLPLESETQTIIVSGLALEHGLAIMGSAISSSNDPSGAIFYPSNLNTVETNLKLWLDGKNIDGLNNVTLSNGNSIETWQDLSGNNNNATIANRGSGGGGAASAQGGNGSAGVIILRFSNNYTATVSGGVTSSTTSAGSDTVLTITATSDSSQTVSFS